MFYLFPLCLRDRFIDTYICILAIKGSKVPFFFYSSNCVIQTYNKIKNVFNIDCSYINKNIIKQQLIHAVHITELKLKVNLKYINILKL